MNVVTWFSVVMLIPDRKVQETMCQVIFHDFLAWLVHILMLRPF